MDIEEIIGAITAELEKRGISRFSAEQVLFALDKVGYDVAREQ